MRPGDTTTFRGPSLIDGHVHFHGGFGRAAFLTVAAGNFSRAAREQGISESHLGWLLFTESRGKDHFAEFRRAVGEKDIPGWSLRETAESCSLIAENVDHDRLVLVAGRQIVVAEGLEVLALGLVGDYPDGASLADTLDDVAARQAIPVLPWGFGKWWFRRGQIMEQLVRGPGRRDFYLGDNGGRPQLFPDPKLFRSARSMGILNLPGSDPLPLARSIHKVGCFGFRIDSSIDLSRPFDSLKTALNISGSQPATFGGRTGFLPFLRDQVALRLGGKRQPGALV